MAKAESEENSYATKAYDSKNGELIAGEEISETGINDQCIGGISAYRVNGKALMKMAKYVSQWRKSKEII